MVPTAHAHAAAVAQAIKASGVVVSVDPDVFARIVGKQEEPLVIRAPGGFMRSHWRYLTSFKGLAFFAKSDEPLPLPGKAEVIDAKKMWVPE
jgi:hypothetical protein